MEERTTCKSRSSKSTSATEIVIPPATIVPLFRTRSSRSQSETRRVSASAGRFDKSTLVLLAAPRVRRGGGTTGIVVLDPLVALQGVPLHSVEPVKQRPFVRVELRLGDLAGLEPQVQITQLRGNRRVLVRQLLLRGPVNFPADPADARQREQQDVVNKQHRRRALATGIQVSRSRSTKLCGAHGPLCRNAKWLSKSRAASTTAASNCSFLSRSTRQARFITSRSLRQVLLLISTQVRTSAFSTRRVQASRSSLRTWSKS